MVHLLRHGPPARAGLLLGHTDETALTDDCPQMRSRVHRLRVEHVVTSDLARASRQAKNLARDSGVSLRVDRDWRELDFGTWEGLAPESLDPGTLAQFWDDPENHAPAGGERWSELKARVAAAIERLDTHSLVVTHAGAMRAAVSVLTGLDHRSVWALDVPYRALLSLRIWAGTPASGQVIGLVAEAAP